MEERILWLALQMASKEILKFWDKDINKLSHEIAEYYYEKAKKELLGDKE